MTSLIHLSDLHFGRESRPMIEAVLRFARQHSPDLVVVSGNLTWSADAGQFRAARSFIERLAPARVVMPGPRDLPGFLPERLLSPLERFRREFGYEADPFFESPAMLVLGVDSTRRQLRDGGVLSGAQIDRSAHRLEHASDTQLRIVVTHHPVAALRPQDQPQLAKDHESAVGAWAEAGADLILGGHLMTPFVTALHRRYEQLPKTMWAVQAGSASSARLRDGANSFNYLHFEPARSRRRSVTVERWDHAAKTGQFHCMKSEELHVHDTIFSRSKAA